MPITSLIIVATIVVAFVGFAVILAWGDHQTRNIGRDADEPVGTQAQVQSLKAAAEAVDRNRARTKATTL